MDAFLARHDRDARVLGEGLHEALVAVGIGRMARDAARVPDRAFAAHLLEQPRGALVGVLDLVVRQVDGFRVGHGGIDGDGLDAGRLRLVEGRIERLRVERIEHDRVHVGRDQVTDVGKLALGIGVPMDPGAGLDLTRLECLGLGRAELLLAEAVADAERVREADRVRAAAARRSGRGRLGRRRSGCRQAARTPRGSDAGAAVPPLLEQAAATTARTAMPTSSRDLIIPVLLLLFATSHSRRVDQWMPRQGADRSVYSSHLLRVSSAAIRPPHRWRGLLAAHAHDRRRRTTTASVRRLRPTLG